MMMCLLLGATVSATGDTGILLASASLAMESSGSTLPYRPFLDPLPLDRYWLVLLAPMVIAIGIVYKSIKLNDLSQLPTQALFLSVQIIVFMVLTAGALWLMVQIV